jgi:hypothetical protein
MLSVDYDDADEWVQMIRCLQCDLVGVFLFDLAIFQPGIYLHLATA